MSGKRTAILGIGNSQRGDDGAGPNLIQRLNGKLRVALIDAGEVPENHLNPIKAANPQFILVVDCIQMGAQPGDVALLDVEHLSDLCGTTHNPGLGVFVRVVQKTTGADVAILAIQPEQIEYGEGFSARVEKTLNYLESILQQALKGEG